MQVQDYRFLQMPIGQLTRISLHGTIRSHGLYVFVLTPQADSSNISSVPAWPSLVERAHSLTINDVSDKRFITCTRSCKSRSGIYYRSQIVLPSPNSVTSTCHHQVRSHVGVTGLCPHRWPRSFFLNVKMAQKLFLLFLQSCAVLRRRTVRSDQFSCRLV